MRMKDRNQVCLALRHVVAVYPPRWIHHPDAQRDAPTVIEVYLSGIADEWHLVYDTPEAARADYEALVGALDRVESR